MRDIELMVMSWCQHNSTPYICKKHYTVDQLKSLSKHSSLSIKKKKNHRSKNYANGHVVIEVVIKIFCSMPHHFDFWVKYVFSPYKVTSF